MSKSILFPDQQQLTIGIDVAAKTLDVAVFAGDGQTMTLPTVDNTPKGWRALARCLTARGDQRIHWVCLEATGRYSHGVAASLLKHGFRVSLLDPRAVKDYGKSQMQRNKTDAADALLIARFGAHQAQFKRLRPYVPNTPAQQRLHEHVQLMQTFQSDYQAHLNRLAGLTNQAAIKKLKRVMAALQKQLTTIDAEMTALCEEAPEFARQTELLKSIPGVAAKTVMVLLDEKVDQHTDVRALAAMHSLSPAQEQSGTSLNRSRLSSRGRRALRTALYHPTMSAMQHNPLVRAFADRLRGRGITGKKLVCACMHKQLRIIFGVLKNGQPFNPDILTDNAK